MEIIKGNKYYYDLEGKESNIDTYTVICVKPGKINSIVFSEQTKETFKTQNSRLTTYHKEDSNKFVVYRNDSLLYDSISDYDYARVKSMYTFLQDIDSRCEDLMKANEYNSFHKICTVYKRLTLEVLEFYSRILESNMSKKSSIIFNLRNRLDIKEFEENFDNEFNNKDCHEELNCDYDGDINYDIYNDFDYGCFEEEENDEYEEDDDDDIIENIEYDIYSDEDYKSKAINNAKLNPLKIVNLPGKNHTTAITNDDDIDKFKENIVRHLIYITNKCDITKGLLMVYFDVKEELLPKHFIKSCENITNEEKQKSYINDSVDYKSEFFSIQDSEYAIYKKIDAIFEKYRKSDGSLSTIPFIPYISVIFASK